MRSVPLLSGITLAAAVILAPPPARAWITQTTDNSPTPTPLLPPQWWHWWGARANPKAPAPACRSKYCPPYYSETHGYTPPQWRPWPGLLEQQMTAAPKADVNPPMEGTGTNTTAAPAALPEAVETARPKK